MSGSPGGILLAFFDYVSKAAPALLPALKNAMCAFWQCRQDLGPLPPDLRADFERVDREIDARRKKDP